MGHVTAMVDQQPSPFGSLHRLAGPAVAHVTSVFWAEHVWGLELEPELELEPGPGQVGGSE
jgi:hypothetical protein